MSDEWNYTTEPAGEPLFVGAITGEMVDRAAAAMARLVIPFRPFRFLMDSQQEHYRALARTGLSAALSSPRTNLTKEDR